MKWGREARLYFTSSPGKRVREMRVRVPRVLRLSTNSEKKKKERITRVSVCSVLQRKRLQLKMKAARLRVVWSFPTLRRGPGVLVGPCLTGLVRGPSIFSGAIFITQWGPHVNSFFCYTSILFFLTFKSFLIPFIKSFCSSLCLLNREHVYIFIFSLKY